MSANPLIRAAVIRPGQSNPAKIKSLTALYFESKIDGTDDVTQLLLAIEGLATETLMETECPHCAGLVF